MAYAELEVGFHRQRSDTAEPGTSLSYDVELRYSVPPPPGTPEASEPVVKRGECRIDFGTLRKLRLKSAEYGLALCEQLFSDPVVRETYTTAKALAQSAEAGTHLEGLRLRLLIHDSAPELHAVRWELLADPQTEQPLTSSERVLFSRFLSATDWTTVRPRPKAELKVLIAVAAPNDLDSMDDELELAEIHRDAEIIQVQASLKGIKEHNIIVAEDPLTYERLIEHLRDDVDILYLVCHGALKDGKDPKLFLQTKQGGVDVVDGRQLARELRDRRIRQLPRLVVLASCESAGTKAAAAGDGTSTQSSLAPLLADAGIPAIVAMQGKITMESSATFMPRFFAELTDHGQIDRAMAAARSELRDRKDQWLPALFLRLAGGRIWYEAGFAGEEFNWKGMSSFVERGECTPVLGWGLGEGVYGSREDLARDLAGETYPFSPFHRFDLARVSQFLRSYAETETIALDVIKAKLRDAAFLRHHRKLDPSLATARLAPVVREVAGLYKDDPTHPHTILAKLKAPIYVNASRDDLLAHALVHAGAHPLTVFSIWKSDGPVVAFDENGQQLFEHDKNGEVRTDAEGNRRPAKNLPPPTPDAPWVFHILGHWRNEESLVLREDDYFDYLVRVGEKKTLVPLPVRTALTDRALMFLGFQLTDWSFRVLFRLIMNQGGNNRLDRYCHAAVQIDPEGDRMLNAEQAKRYLKEDFDFDMKKLSIYWGTGQDFLLDLDKNVTDAPAWQGEGAY